MGAIAPRIPGVDAAGVEGGLRVEDLARETGASVDTIRFYQKRRLLAPPTREGRIAWYGPEHVARLARIRELQGRGFSLAVIRRLLEGELDPADEPLAAAVVGAAAGDTDGELLTLAELAQRAGVPEAILAAVAGEGLLVPRRRDGVDHYPATDIELVQAGLRLLEAGLPMPALLALARRHHEMTRAIAEDAVQMFDEHVRAIARRAALRRREGRAPGRRVPNPAADGDRTRCPTLPCRAARGRARAPRGHRRSGRARRRAWRARLGSHGTMTRGSGATPVLGRDGSLPQGDEKRRAVDDMFDRVAPRYDRMNRVISLGLDRRWRKRTVASLGLPPGARVLDLACGTGDLSRDLADAGYEPVGLDRSDGMLAAARTRAPLVRGDGEALPFPDGSLDGVVCGFALRNFVALGTVFGECARVLRAGGALRGPRRGGSRAHCFEPATPSGSVARCRCSAGCWRTTPRRTGISRGRPPTSPSR